MNTHMTNFPQYPDRQDAEEALELLRDWAARATPEEIADLDPSVARLLPQGGANAGPVLSRSYPADFVADAVYKATMPDLQNGPASLIRGAKRRIAHVGISNFRLPIRFHRREGADLALDTSVVGTVSLDAAKKGINMSRIMRSFYASAERTFSFEVIEDALESYKRDLDSFDARIMMRFSFPMRVASLRSGLEGYQYYDMALEVVDHGAGGALKAMHLDYVYSSTCPCSLELAEHARTVRGQLATPHSQRSVARLSMVVEPGTDCLWFEDVVEMCRRAVPTETQVMVKREDEQAFAELNAANPIFVEDAARLFAEQLEADPRIGDFRVVASHQESLHSHDAVSVLVEGESFSERSLEPHLFESLRHRG